MNLRDKDEKRLYRLFAAGVLVVSGIGGYLALIPLCCL